MLHMRCGIKIHSYYFLLSFLRHVFAKETHDGHASRVKTSFRPPLTRTGVDEENTFLS